MWKKTLLAASMICFSSVAHASIDPKCAGLAKPENYSEVAQQDYMMNFFALSTTLSPIHAPVPHEGGHGAIGVDLLVIPPLSCEHRYVLEWTKTEETNKTPIAPRPRITFAFKGPKGLVPYAGFAYLPPVTLLGTRNVIVSGEIGLGGVIKERFEVGGRFHATLQKTIADVATAFEESGPVVNDFYFASTFGVDAMFGVRFGPVTPYAALGFTDVSTFFMVGDDSVVTNNYHPYFGPNFSVGADMLFVKHLRIGAEFYGAPGGRSLPDKTVDNAGGFGRYGHVYTGRIRLAYEI